MGVQVALPVTRRHVAQDGNLRRLGSPTGAGPVREKATAAITLTAIRKRATERSRFCMEATVVLNQLNFV